MPPLMDWEPYWTRIVQTRGNQWLMPLGPSQTQRRDTHRLRRKLNVGKWKVPQLYSGTTVYTGIGSQTSTELELEASGPRLRMAKYAQHEFLYARADCTDGTDDTELESEVEAYLNSTATPPKLMEYTQAQRDDPTCAKNIVGRNGQAKTVSIVRKSIDIGAVIQQSDCGAIKAKKTNTWKHTWGTSRKQTSSPMFRMVWRQKSKPNHWFLRPYPWQMVGTDLFELKGQQYLVVVDYYSECIKLSQTTSAYIISMQFLVDMEFRKPYVATMVLHMSSRKFLKRMGLIKHITSSPHYPQSNGAYGSVIKSILKKSVDPHLAILSYRATPMQWCGLSPSELSMGRKIRTTIPQITEHQSQNTLSAIFTRLPKSEYFL